MRWGRLIVPSTCHPQGADGAECSGSSGALAACVLRLPNLHTAEREYRARMYRLLLRRSGIAQLGVYTTGTRLALLSSSQGSCACLRRSV